LFKKRIYSIFLGTFVGKRKQTILKKRWFDITSTRTVCSKVHRFLLFDKNSSNRCKTNKNSETFLSKIFHFLFKILAKFVKNILETNSFS
jgi:hypothetical protein